MKDADILNLIMHGKQSKALEKLYKIYPAVRKYIFEGGGNEADAEDIFQDALLIFMEKALDNKLTLTAALSTYLFGICKNLFREKQRELNKFPAKDFYEDENLFAKDIQEFLEEEQKYHSLDKILEETGKTCLELLRMFYYENLSMKAIATKLGFKSETSAKTQKYKCLEKARNLTESFLTVSNTATL